MKGFKFFNSAHSDAVYQHGSVRVGTAADYRVADGFTDGRSDDREALNHWTIPEGGALLSDHPGVLEAIHGDGPIPPEAGNMRFTSERTSTFLFMANVYMLSFSLHLSEKLKRRMRKTFDADACYEILDITRYALEVTARAPLLWEQRQLSPVGQRYACQRVRYDQPENEDTRATAPDPFSKRRRFEWQDEGRMIWHSQREIKPFTVTVPGILPLIRKAW